MASRPESSSQLRQCPEPRLLIRRAGKRQKHKQIKRGMSDASDLHQIHMMDTLLWNMDGANKGQAHVIGKNTDRVSTNMLHASLRLII